MEVGQLQRSFVEYMASLFREGFLDAQFSQLQQLQDDSNPDFVVEVVSLFFEDSERLLNDLTMALDQPNVDFKQVDAHVHQLKGSSSSVGAQRVKNCCVPFRNCCEEQNTETCLRCLQQIKQEYLLVKNKLQTLFELAFFLATVGAADCSCWRSNSHGAITQCLTGLASPSEGKCLLNSVCREEFSFSDFLVDHIINFIHQIGLCLL
ncbi:hypothetical protein MTR67_003725 [Solanum verrucosum]|uniref:Histidine-containing phosphotransfer protein n=1 Tax=Solanum verrucosum TaxID=315347 RepID=A0AAF0PUV2_SOLVR|nr:hypothetical protein MTR67_003725 [Solanum verrucosum]